MSTAAREALVGVGFQAEVKSGRPGREAGLVVEGKRGVGEEGLEVMAAVGAVVVLEVVETGWMETTRF